MLPIISTFAPGPQTPRAALTLPVISALKAKAPREHIDVRRNTSVLDNCYIVLLRNIYIITVNCGVAIIRRFLYRKSPARPATRMHSANARITCGAVRRLATTSEQKSYLPMAVIAFSDRCFYVPCYASFALFEPIPATIRSSSLLWTWSYRDRRKRNVERARL